MTSPQSAADLSRNALAEISRHAARAEGQVGVAVRRLDGAGPALMINADQPFPMASTFKVAVACRILERVARGEMVLDECLEITDEMRVSSSVIAERFPHPGVRLSVHNLLQVMLDESDNTATDVLVAAAGGPEAVTAALRRWGVEGQRVDRDTRRLIRDFYGLDEGPFLPALEAARSRPDHADRIRAPNPRFEDDGRDVSTPAAMTDLLCDLFCGRLPIADTVGVLRGIMGACRTGDTRLRGLLPEGTRVFNKTGTIGGVVNDVGLIALPEDRGEIVISVFIKLGRAPYEVRERAIAEIARTAYDFFLLIG